MARSLHFPTDLNLDNARPLAPQWMTNQQDASGAGTQNIKSALVSALNTQRCVSHAHTTARSPCDFMRGAKM